MRWLTDLWELEKDIANLEKDLMRFKKESPKHEAIPALEGIIEFKKETRTEIGDLVGTFKGLDNKIMKLKYIDGLTLEKAAQRLGYSYNYVRRIHADLMKKMKSSEVK